VHWTAEEESHELWIADSGGTIEVMMASVNKGPVHAKLAGYEADMNKLKGPGSKERKERARAAIASARKLLDSTLAEARAAKAAAAKAEGKPGDFEEKNSKTESWEELLWPELQAIQIALKIIPLPKTVIHGGGIKASTVRAEPLSKEGEGGGKPAGDVIGWKHVTSIDRANLNVKTGVMGPAYWVRAHLVSEWLHGPGKPWNLVPLLKSYNTEMEVAVESKAYERIMQDEVLYYVATVDYHAPPCPDGFPSMLSINWGAMRYENGKWEEADALGTYSTSPAAPPLEGQFVPRINEVGRPALVSLGVPMRFAMALIEERNANGDFSEPDLSSRMTKVYATRGGDADLNLTLGLMKVGQLIKSKELSW